VRLLLGEGDSCYRQRRTGERRRKSVRGCIMNTDIQAYHLIIVKQGEQEIAGLTDADSTVPKRLGPKRANRECLEIGGVVRQGTRTRSGRCTLGEGMLARHGWHEGLRCRGAHTLSACFCPPLALPHHADALPSQTSASSST